MKVVTAEQMMRIDRECESKGLPTSVLMENAGKAFAEEVMRVTGDMDHMHILVLAGPGNNGGDGLVAARYFHDQGIKVTLYLFGNRSEDDANLALVRERGITTVAVADEQDLADLDEVLRRSDIVVDALFGTGNNRPLGGVYKQALEIVGDVKKEIRSLRVFALDIPSGMNADAGAADAVSLHADYTVTLGYPKVGLYTPAALGHTGEISIVDIGIPPGMADDVNVELVDAALAGSLLPARPAGANKGTFGKVMVIAGSINYIGAAYLSCMGAMRVGAGLVTLATPASLQPVLASKLTEVTYLPLPEAEKGIISPQAAGIVLDNIGDYDVILAGCGLGQSKPVKEFLKSLLLENSEALPQLVLDADALNTLAGVSGWWEKISGEAILTPHPGELARLAGLTVDEVLSDRLNIAVKYTREWGKVIVHKGGYTMVTTPEGRSVIYPLANPGLASAGTGDVLAGIITGLAAQGLKPADAAICGIYIGGEAGKAVREKMGDAGMIASDLLPVLPVVIKQIKDSVL